MSPNSARLAILPKAVATEVVTSAVSRAAWAVSVMIVLADIPVVVDIVTGRTNGEHLWQPLLAILGMLALLAYTGLRPSTRSRVVFLVVGAVLAGVYQVSILRADPTIQDEGIYVLNRLAFVLVLVSPAITRPAAGVRWTVIGYVVAMTTMQVSNLIVAAPLVTGFGPTFALVIACCAYLTIAGIGAANDGQLPTLRRLEDETRGAALEHQYEQRAAAVIHDTVLNDLSTIMNTDGPLHDKVRERLRADVATLRDGAWLRETRDSVDLAGTDAALRNEIMALISEMQWRGLTVDLTGGSEEEIARLSPENVATATAAVRACLDNVVAHAQTSVVELVLSATEGSVTIMVIDQGAGFDPAAVPADRLGLRASVVRRVEAAGGTVRIWSKPKSGTSVLISLPSEASK